MNAISLNDTDDAEILKVREEYQEYYKEIDEEVKKEREKVIAAGGLKIIGTERHESRRIDNQLRGRSGRQGDVGESRFYISLEDDLMKLFGGDKVQMVAAAINMPEDMPLEMGILTSSIQNAQKNVESVHFQARKNVLQYDNVMNEQRQIIYGERRRVLEGENLRDNIMNMLKRTIDEVVDSYFNVYDTDDINVEAFENYLQTTLTVEYKVGDERDPETIKNVVLELAKKKYEQKEEELGDRVRELERIVLLRTVDEKWMDHIDAMEQLKESVRLQGYAQKDPVVEFKLASYDYFNEMTASIEETVVKTMLHLVPREKVERVNLIKNMITNMQAAQKAAEMARKHLR